MIAKLLKLTDTLTEPAFALLPEFARNTAGRLARDGFHAAACTALGLSEKNVGALVETSYLEGGNPRGEVLICLHGFSDSKFGFLALAPLLLSRFRLVIPDLPGFGGSASAPNGDYSFEFYSRWLTAFLEELEIERAHLLGSSLGGATAALFAVHRPETVGSVILAGAAGVMDSEPAGIYERIVTGENVFAVEHPADFEIFLRNVFHRAPWMGPAYKHDFYRELVARKDDYERIMRALSGGLYTPGGEVDESRVDPGLRDNLFLNERLRELRAPTLLVWGEYDSIFPPSIARIFAANIPDSRLEIITDAGHLPHIETPGKFAELVLGFLGR